MQLALIRVYKSGSMLPLLSPKFDKNHLNQWYKKNLNNNKYIIPFALALS